MICQWWKVISLELWGSEGAEVVCVHGLCYVGCAHMAGQQNNKETNFLFWRGDGMGFCPALLSLCVCASPPLPSPPLPSPPCFLFWVLCQFIDYFQTIIGLSLAKGCMRFITAHNGGLQYGRICLILHWITPERGRWTIRKGYSKCNRASDKGTLGC